MQARTLHPSMRVLLQHWTNHGRVCPPEPLLPPFSHCIRTLSPLNTSGAMYAGVPTVVLGVESVTLDLE